MSIALVALAVLWLSLIVYAVLGGADFGAGIWDLFAVGRQALIQRKLINQALGPVWEANHVWLIFLIVGLFNIFPNAFAVLTTALFVPLTVALVGIVLRGAAFIFRYYAVRENNPVTVAWSRIFSASSVITPFFLGASAAAVASGNISISATGLVQADPTKTWASPFALVIGAMAVTLCAALAAVYLTVEAQAQRENELAEGYRMRAIIAGGATAVFGTLGLFLASREAMLLWDGLFNRAIPVVIATMLIGLATAGLLFARRYRLARVMIGLETAFLLGSWGLSQYPYIIPPHITIDNSANQPQVIQAVLISVLVGMAILLPSLYYLFSVFKLPYRVPGLQKKQP